MQRIENSPLGKSSPYVDEYAPSLLYPVPRAPLRRELGIEADPPFTGSDIWNAYELSWLNARGKPRIALASITVAANSANIVESKSFKLYLNSYNQTRLHGDLAEVRSNLERDLSAAFGGAVKISLRQPLDCGRETYAIWEGECLDDQDIEVERYSPDPELLRAGGDFVEEALYSDLLKSNCPITGQPDWASVHISYRGARMDREGLLRYLISFRRHGGFHEHCVERIFMDLLKHCRPEQLSVYARYTRRGGLDINPFRTNCGASPPPNRRLVRQ